MTIKYTDFTGMNFLVTSLYKELRLAEVLTEVGETM